MRPYSFAAVLFLIVEENFREASIYDREAPTHMNIIIYAPHGRPRPSVALAKEGINKAFAHFAW